MPRRVPNWPFLSYLIDLIFGFKHNEKVKFFSAMSVISNFLGGRSSGGGGGGGGGGEVKMPDVHCECLISKSIFSNLSRVLRSLIPPLETHAD